LTQYYEDLVTKRRYLYFNLRIQIWNDVEESLCGLTNSRWYLATCLARMERTTENVRQNSWWWRCWDSIREPFEHKSTTLSRARAACSVNKTIKVWWHNHINLRTHQDSERTWA